MSLFEEADEYCPHCDNHFVSVSPQSLSYSQYSW